MNDTIIQTAQKNYTQIGDTGAIWHTFTMGELLIAMLLLIIIFILLANMKNWSKN